ncbi:hypothetical protein EON65_48255 [archaeon]|nr:MAG: hypothetical protein EON65_48255 [archaeon]
MKGTVVSSKSLIIHWLAVASHLQAYLATMPTKIAPFLIVLFLEICYVRSSSLKRISSSRRLYSSPIDPSSPGTEDSMRDMMTEVNLSELSRHP